MEKTTIPVYRGYKGSLTGCVLKFSKGVLDKFNVVKE